jgi:hypothetical protein
VEDRPDDAIRAGQAMVEGICDWHHARAQRALAGGVLSPCPLLPQQATVPSVFTPQVWASPALTWVKVPAGAVFSPELFWLQQTTDPPILMPQV